MPGAAVCDRYSHSSSSSNRRACQPQQLPSHSCCAAPESAEHSTPPCLPLAPPPPICSPGTTSAGQKASCSFSLKKLSGFLLSTMRPTGCRGNTSSGHTLVTSRGSNENLGCEGGRAHAANMTSAERQQMHPCIREVYSSSGALTGLGCSAQAVISSPAAVHPRPPPPDTPHTQTPNRVCPGTSHPLTCPGQLGPWSV